MALVGARPGPNPAGGLHSAMPCHGDCTVPCTPYHTPLCTAIHPYAVPRQSWTLTGLGMPLSGASWRASSRHHVALCRVTYLQAPFWHPSISLRPVHCCEMSHTTMGCVESHTMHCDAPSAAGYDAGPLPLSRQGQVQRVESSLADRYAACVLQGMSCSQIVIGAYGCTLPPASI